MHGRKAMDAAAHHSSSLVEESAHDGELEERIECHVIICAGGTVWRHEARPGRRRHEACCRRERGRGDGGSGGREPCVGAPGALCRMQRENRSVAGYGIGKQVWLQALRCRRSREWKQYLVAALRETFRESVHHTYP